MVYPMQEPTLKPLGFPLAFTSTILVFFFASLFLGILLSMPSQGLRSFAARARRFAVVPTRDQNLTGGASAASKRQPAQKQRAQPATRASHGGTPAIHGVEEELG